MKISSQNNSGNISLAIVVPVLDEWKSLALLLPMFDRNLNRKDFAVEVIVVDDGSRLSFIETDFVSTALENITKISFFTHQLARTGKKSPAFARQHRFRRTNISLAVFF